jgi:hypothetical protein
MSSTSPWVCPKRGGQVGEWEVGAYTLLTSLAKLP